MSEQTESKAANDRTVPIEPSTAPFTGLWLIAADTGYPFAPLTDFTTIDVSDPFLPWQTDVGYFTQDKIRSVIYLVDGGKSVIRDKPPYPLLGYKCDPFHPGFPTELPKQHPKLHLIGPHEISVTPCLGPHGQQPGVTTTVHFNIWQSIRVVRPSKPLEKIGKIHITPVTVTNVGTSPVSLYGPHIYQYGEHVLAAGSPPLPYGHKDLWNQELTAPGDNINFLVTFYKSDDSTWEALENPDGSPFFLAPGQTLYLQSVKPRRPGRPLQGSGGGVTPPPHHPPL